MRDLIRQEQFEMEVLDRLNSGRFLNRMIFCGGTMLRLCHGLDRYSADLDFWLPPQNDYSPWFDRLKNHLSRFYDIRDAADKFYTLIVEVRSSNYPRSLKVEMRKDMNIGETEQAIAYSPHSSIQVFVRSLSLQRVMDLKIEALLQRREIRDAYDLEFLAKKGVNASLSPRKMERLFAVIDSFTLNDYNVKLGSLLEAKRRAYYKTNNFRILKAHLR